MYTHSFNGFRFQKGLRMDANSKLQNLRNSVVSRISRRSMQEPNLWQGRAHVVFPEFLSQNTVLFRLRFCNLNFLELKLCVPMWFQCVSMRFLWRDVESCVYFQTSKASGSAETLGSRHGLTGKLFSPQVSFKTN